MTEHAATSPVATAPSLVATASAPAPSAASTDTDAPAAAQSLADYDWSAIEQAIVADGHARLPGLLPMQACRALRAQYDDDRLYRARIVMARHGFGRGEYRYFAYPLPALVQGLRESLYARLAPIATRITDGPGFPARHDAYLRVCEAAGQHRPTPLILRYRPGDYNCLHQDLYGERVFPLQVVVLLSQPGAEFDGGELVLTQARSDGQEAEVLPLAQGDAAIITVASRSVPGARGRRRLAMRHGVSRLLRGERHTLGVIFHDAR